MTLSPDLWNLLLADQPVFSDQLSNDDVRALEQLVELSTKLRVSFIYGTYQRGYLVIPRPVSDMVPSEWATLVNDLRGRKLYAAALEIAARGR
jgi:hypothetical protein